MVELRRSLPKIDLFSFRKAFVLLMSQFYPASVYPFTGVLRPDIDPYHINSVALPLSSTTSVAELLARYDFTLLFTLLCCFLTLDC